jgi:hypothetical protein
MTIALCIRCGEYKRGAVTACRNCDYAPCGETELTYSAVLSDNYFNRETLDRIAADIRDTGEYPKLPREQEEKFLRAVAEDRNMQTILEFNAVNNEAAAAKKALPPADFEFVSRLPLLVFVTVAGADGKIDQKEMAAFEDLMRLPVCARAFKSPLFKALVIFGENALDAGGVRNLEPGNALEVATIIGRHCSEREFAAFAEDVQSLGFIVAGASGGLLGLGSKISRAEREAIAGLKQAFTKSATSRHEPSPVDLALSWIDAFERLFADTFGIQANRSEIGSYVVSMLDFCLQANTEAAAYKRDISAIARAVAAHCQIAPDNLAQLVSERGRGYVKLTLDVMSAICCSNAADNNNPEAQMAWEFYSRATHRDPRGQMIQLLTELAPAMIDFVLTTEKLAAGMRS